MICRLDMENKLGNCCVSEIRRKGFTLLWVPAIHVASLQLCGVSSCIVLESWRRNRGCNPPGFLEWTVDQKQIVKRIQAHQARLTELGVASLSLFGSVARGDSTEDSDIDLLVRFDGRADFDRYMDLKFFLEDLLGQRVDLITEQALREEVRAQVEQDLLRVA